LEVLEGGWNGKLRQFLSCRQVARASSRKQYVSRRKYSSTTLRGKRNERKSCNL